MKKVPKKRWDTLEKEAILQSGMTQEEIAKKIGVKQSCVSNYLHGKKTPSLDTFANLCRALDVDANDLLCLL